MIAPLSPALLCALVGDERNGPPEDCDGIPGFYGLLGALADPKHPNHADAKRWSDDYDPSTFDELPIKYALGRIAKWRDAARSRLAKKLLGLNA
jgi:hypothetical protein